MRAADHRRAGSPTRPARRGEAGVVGRPWHSRTTLSPLAVVTWTIEPERLARALPAGVDPDVVDVDGTPVALGSLVAFVARDFHFRGVPFVRHSFGQVDHRVHVRRGDQRGVWFVAASIDSPVAWLPRAVWAMPWHHDRIRIDAEPDAHLDRGDGLRRFDLSTTGGTRGSEIELVVGGDDQPDGGYDVAAITDPTLGWYPRTRGGIASYEVRHPPFELRPMVARHAVAGALRHLDLIDQDQPPLAAGVAAASTLELLTPPRRVTR